MAKSSPTKLQRKHIPDTAMLYVLWGLQSIAMSTVHFSSIAKVYSAFPEKVVLRKLEQLEDRGLIDGYGPSGLHYQINLEGATYLKS